MPQNVSRDTDAKAILSNQLQARSGLMTASTACTEEVEADALNPRDYISSLARGLDVLRAFNRTGARMTLSEVAAETGTTRAGARRILLTLAHEGYAVHDGKLFDLTPQVLELGYSVVSAKGAWDVARPFIDHLSEDICESVSASVLDGMYIVNVGGTTFHRLISVGITVGARFPAHSAAAGRVLLAQTPRVKLMEMLHRKTLEKTTEYTVTDPLALMAELESVRDQGWSIVEQELEKGLISMAVPLFSQNNVLVGALNVGVPIQRRTRQDMIDSVLPKLQTARQDISEALRL